MRRKIVRGAVSLLFFFFSLVLVFIACEGLSSLILLIHGFTSDFNSGPISRTHVKYDKELGWINKPNLNIPDMYGPGISFQTNSLSHRGKRELKAAVPDSKIRIVCIGDSFTLGTGVDDDHTYPQLLMQIDNRFETVNLGEAGYGIGQAYLRYLREYTKLDHDVLVFAFIHDNIRRMRLNRFGGYGKPLLTIDNKRIMVKNVPVPRKGYILPFLTHNRDKIFSLRSIQLLRKFFGKFRSSPESQFVTPDSKTSTENDETMELLMTIFEELIELCRVKDRQALFVYLEEPEKKNIEPWEKLLLAEARRRGIPLLDLTEAFRKLPKFKRAGLFDPKWYHYNSEGNKFVAERIHEEVLRILKR